MECVTSFTDILLDSVSCQVLLIICIIIVIRGIPVILVMSVIM